MKKTRRKKKKKRAKNSKERKHAKKTPYVQPSYSSPENIKERKIRKKL